MAPVIVAFVASAATGRFRPDGDREPPLPGVLLRPHVTFDFTSLYFFVRTALLLASILFITASHLFGAAVVLRTTATTDEAVVVVDVDADVVDVVCDALLPLGVGDTDDALLSLWMASQAPPIVDVVGCGRECVAVVAFDERLTQWLAAVGRTAPELLLLPVPPPLAPPPPTDEVDDDVDADAAVANKPRCLSSGFFVGLADAVLTSFFVCFRCAAISEAAGEAVVGFFIVVAVATGDDLDAPV